MSEHLKHEGILDRAALAVSVLCLIDCTVLPIVAALAPVTGFAGLDHQMVDRLLTRLILPLVTLALVLGYRRHHSVSLTLAGFSGLGLVLYGHHVEWPLISVAGGVFLVGAQWLGRSRGAACCAHHPAPLVALGPRPPR